MSEPEQPIADPSEQRAHDLQRASDFCTVLLAMAGHDLRQPLQIITGTYSWLSHRLDTSSEKEYLRRGEFAIAQLTEHLDRLVDALRMQQHATSAGLMPVQLGPLLSHLYLDHLIPARQKGVTIRVCRTRAAVMSEPVLLEAILRNLIRNALKYTRPGGRVLLGCRRHGPDIAIGVHDTGVGIAPDQLAKVFEAFHRLDSSGADGLGLGLFVVRRAVDLLGHRIVVRSAVGRGSCFSVVARNAEGTAQ